MDVDYKYKFGGMIYSIMLAPSCRVMLVRAILLL